jgi:hypothetical protein
MQELKVACKTEAHLPYGEIEPFQGNLKKRTGDIVDKLCRSIIKHGWSFPEFIWKNDGHNYCLDGHGRLAAIPKLEKMGYSIPPLPVVYVDAKDKNEAKELLLKLNSTYGVLDTEGFKAFIDGLEIDWSDLSLPSGELFEFPDLSSGGSEEHQSLAERFIIPPLSVFRVASGYWQERKKAWISLGIQSEKGRNDGMLKNMAMLAKKASGSNLPSESIFDPVLCEIMYRWFCTGGGQVFDPFAGGSVRGIVAGNLGYSYTGIDLRQEQIEANNEQIEIACNRNPVWICADSTKMDAVLPHDFQCDFVFSCPPYADLEVYSDNPADLSVMTYSDFRIAYFDIITKSVARLRDNSFACFVVGEARSKTGSYYGLVPDTVRAFEEAGAYFYNEMILVTQIAAKALTVAEGFVKSRKIGKIHQNILIFVKGDPVKAAQKCKIERQELADAISAEVANSETEATA